MPRCGLFDHSVEVLRYIDNTSESGMRSKVRSTVCTLRARLIRKEGSYKVNDQEQYDTQTIVLEAWKNSLVKDTDNVCYCGQEFRIVFIDYGDRDLTMRITAKKIIK